MLTLDETTQDTVVVNENGVDIDFRVETDSRTHAFFVRGSDGFIGVNMSNPLYDVDVTGDIHASGDIISNSDIRLKTNIKPMNNVLDDIMKLTPSTFDWKESGKEDIGLIAQEVEEIFPEIVRTDDNGYKSISYQKLSVILLKAIQEIIKK